MTIMHPKCFKFSFCFANGILVSEIGFKFLEEESKIRKAKWVHLDPRVQV